jgi:nucleotide-binding universal stress UspA family protein
MSGNCLVYTNLSDGLQRLIHFVPQLASGGIKQVVFLHSVPVWDESRVAGIDEERLQQAREKLSPALQYSSEAIKVEVEVVSGQSTDAALKVIHRYDIDLIIMATPVRTGLESQLFGDDTLNLARATSIPLLIFRPQLISTYTCEELGLRCQHLWQDLLIPYDDGDSARYLIQRLKEYIVNNLDHHLRCARLLWVIEESRLSELNPDRFREAESKLAEIKKDLAGLGLDVVTEVRKGEPLLAILDTALKEDISAIAIASSQRNRLMELAFPSFANEVLSHSWFPVLYFSPKQ